MAEEVYFKFRCGNCDERLYHGSATPQDADDALARHRSGETQEYLRDVRHRCPGGGTGLAEVVGFGAAEMAV